MVGVGDNDDSGRGGVESIAWDASEKGKATYGAGGLELFERVGHFCCS